jgi:eukaryotic-like serine/threonine-protein kinase
MNAKQLILDRYLLQKRIALGGSAEVWHARDRKLNRAVAVKLLHAHLLPDASSRKRLAAEARAASKLTHPGIVEIFDVDAEGEVPALVMELVDGESLAERLERDGALPAEEAARVGAEVADALYHAHRLGIIHRDVKPGNILLGRDGSARLVDFGIARSLAEAAERTTLVGSVVGTLRYMAPEQLTDGDVGPRTDLFGLGVVIHEMVAGRSPFVATTPVGLAEEQAAGPPPIRGVEPRLAEIIRSCLQPDPANRPMHAGALAESLRGWLASDTQTVTQPMPVVPPPTQQPPPARRAPPAGVPAPVPDPPSGRRLPISLAAALAGVALLALLAFALLDPSRDAASSPPSPTPTVVATPTPPAWLAGLMHDYTKACGSDQADQVSAELASLSEEAALNRVQELIDACKGDKPGKGHGGGNGGGGD